MRRLSGLLLALLAWPAFAQDVRVPDGLQGEAVDRAMPALAREAIAAYRDQDRARRPAANAREPARIRSQGSELAGEGLIDLASGVVQVLGSHLGRVAGQVEPSQILTLGLIERHEALGGMSGG